MINSLFFIYLFIYSFLFFKFILITIDFHLVEWRMIPRRSVAVVLWTYQCHRRLKLLPGIEKWNTQSFVILLSKFKRKNEWK